MPKIIIQMTGGSVGCTTFETPIAAIWVTLSGGAFLCYIKRVMATTHSTLARRPKRDTRSVTTGFFANIKHSKLSLASQVIRTDAVGRCSNFVSESTQSNLRFLWADATKIALNVVASVEDWGGGGGCTPFGLSLVQKSLDCAVHCCESSAVILFAVLDLIQTKHNVLSGHVTLSCAVHGTTERMSSLLR